MTTISVSDERGVYYVSHPAPPGFQWCQIWGKNMHAPKFRKLDMLLIEPARSVTAPGYYIARDDIFDGGDDCCGPYRLIWMQRNNDPRGDPFNLSFMYAGPKTLRTMRPWDIYRRGLPPRPVARVRLVLPHIDCGSAIPAEQEPTRADLRLIVSAAASGGRA